MSRKAPAADSIIRSALLPGFGLSRPDVLEAAWPVRASDPAEPGLPERVRVLQVLRMMEQLATGNLAPASPASSPTGCTRH